MQETHPIAQTLAAPHSDEDTTSHQPPPKRKTRLHSQSKHANSSSQTPTSSRYTRSQAAPDWTVQEVMVLLGEVVAIDEVWLKELSSYQRWKMISDSCMAMNVVRSSNQCKRKWEMLLDDYRKIMKWEPQSREDSYWFLPEERRKDYGLPVSFQKEVFDAMDAVFQVQQQQSDSNNSDPVRITSVPEFETSNVNADSVPEEEELVTTSKIPEVEMSILKSPEKAPVSAGLSLSVPEEEELVTTSKSPEVEESTLKSPEKAPVLAAVPIEDELVAISKSPEMEKSTLVSPEKPIVLAGDGLITTSKSPEVDELITTSKISEERPQVEELNTTSKNLEKRQVEELITTSKRPEVEELITTSKSSEDRLEVEELNRTLKSLEERPEELIITSKSSEVEELITTSKSSEKASVITVFEQEELITNSKISEKARLITDKLQENAEHVCAILRGELQDGASHDPSPLDSLKPSAAETEFARRQADELIKALAELTNSLDELYDHINRRKCTGIVPVDSMA